MKIKANIIVVLTITIIIIAIFAIYQKSDNENVLPEDIRLPKCLIVASYFDGFEGQKLKTIPIYSILKDTCQIRQFNMDTTRNPDQDFAVSQGIKAKEIVDNWKPDIIIAVDDNASKYFVKPYMKDASIPVVFCGIDWTFQEYGYPYKNATGIIEVFPVSQLIQQVKKIIPDAKTAVCIRGNRLSEYKASIHYKKIYKSFNIELIDKPVSSFEEFKTQFLNAQNADFIIFHDYSAIKNFQPEQAKEFIKENCQTLIVSQLKWMAAYSMLSTNQIIEEQGQYAATLALKILDGYPPEKVQIVSNRKWDIFINESLLENTKFIIPEVLRHKAKKVANNLTNVYEEKNKLKKCFYVASYHKGYKWQDELDKALFAWLEGKCKTRSFYMDSKRIFDHDSINARALEAHNIIQKWKPDIIIAADDNASKYLIMPYYKDSKIPVVFCGVNWTADEYGYPFTNTTGMIEISPVLNLWQTIKLINKNINSGVIIYSNRLTSLKTANRFKDIFKAKDVSINMEVIDTMDDFEKAFSNIQDVDFVFLVNPSSINTWDHEIAIKVVYNTNVIIVTNNEWTMPYAMLGMTNLPAEHGQYAAMTALKILEGTEPSKIPIISNRKWQTYINSKLLNNAGIELPSNIINSAIDITP